MSSSQVDYVMATELALDVAPATRSLSALRRSVSIVTRGWQQQEAALKSAGDAQGAAQAKAAGLARAIETQQKAVDALAEKQRDAVKIARDQAHQMESTKAAIKAKSDEMAKEAEANSKSTKEYKKLRSELLAYQKQLRDIQNVDKTLQSTTSSLEYQRTKLTKLRAEYSSAKTAVNNYTSGLNQLKQNYTQTNALSSARIERMKAEGDRLGALREQSESYARNVTSLTLQLNREREALQSMSGSGSGASAAAINKQKIAVEQTATALTKARTAQKETNDEIDKMTTRTTVWTRMKGAVLGTASAEERARQNVVKLKGVFSGAFFGNFISSQIPSLTGGLKQIISEGKEVAAAGGAMEARWQNLNVSSNGIDRLQKQVGDLKTNTNMSAQAVNGLQTRFYGMTHSVSQTRLLTQGVGSLSDKLKLSQQQADAFAGGLSRIESSGKVTGASLGRLEKQAPGLTSAMAQASGMSQRAFKKLVASGKMTSSQFNQILARSAQDYQKNAQKFDQSAGGAKHALEQQWKSTEAQVAKPLLKVQAQIFGELRQSLANPATQRGIVMLAKGFAQLAVGATKAIGVIAQNQSAVKALAAGIGTLVVAFKTMRAINTTIATLRLFKESIAAVRGATVALRVVLAGGVVGAIIGIGVAFYELYKHNAKFRNFVNKIYADVKNFLGKAVNWVKNNWKNVAEWIINPVGKATTALASKYGPRLKSWAQNALGKSKNWIKSNWKWVTVGIVNPVAGAVTKLYEKNPKFRAWANSMAQQLKSNAPQIKRYFQTEIPEKIKGAGEAVKDAVKNYVDKIEEPFKTMFTWLKGKFDKLKDWVSGAKDDAKNHAAGTSSLASGELAIVNDAHDPHYREALEINGKVTPFPAKRNLKTYLPAGAKVINGEDYHKLLTGQLKPQKAYASGSEGMDALNAVAGGINEDANNWRAGMAATYMQKIEQTFQKELQKLQQQIRQAIVTFKQAQMRAMQQLQKSVKEAAAAFTKTQQDAVQRRQQSLMTAQQSRQKSLATAQKTFTQKMTTAQQTYQRKMQAAQKTHNQKLQQAAQKQVQDHAAAQQKLQQQRQTAQQRHDTSIQTAQQKHTQRVQTADRNFKRRMKNAKTPKAKKNAEKAHNQALQKAQDSLNQATDKAQDRLGQALQKAETKFTTASTKADTRHQTSVNKANQAYGKSVGKAKTAYGNSTRDAQKARRKSLVDAQNTFINSSQNAQTSFLNSMKTAYGTRKKADTKAKQTEVLAVGNASMHERATVTTAKRNIAKLQRWKQQQENALKFQMSHFARGGIANRPSIFGEAGPEAAVPLDSAKEGYAWAQIAEIASRYAGNGGRLPGKGSGEASAGMIADLIRAVQQLDRDLKTGISGIQKGQKSQIGATKGIPGYDHRKVSRDLGGYLQSSIRGSLF